MLKIDQVAGFASNKVLVCIKIKWIIEKKKKVRKIKQYSI